MSDLLSKLVQQAQAQVFNRPVVSQAAAKAVNSAVHQATEKAAGKAADTAAEKVAEKALTLGTDKAVTKAAARTDLAPEAAKRMTQLLDTNATIIMPSDPARLLELTRSGRLASDSDLTLSLGNVSPGDSGRYGKGIYHTPSPTTAAGYTYQDVKTAAEMVSGQVSTGRVVEGSMGASSFDRMADADTRWIQRKNLDVPDVGDYGVTKDPKRFQIKAITRYQPDQAAGLENVIPELLEAHRLAPSWTDSIFKQIEPTRTQRAFEHALKNGPPEVRQGAGFMLARSGDARGIKIATEALKSTTDNTTRSAAGEALREALGQLGDQRLQEADSVLKALAGSSFLTGKESLIAAALEEKLGAPGVKLLTENGWQKVHGARTYWKR